MLWLAVAAHGQVVATTYLHGNFGDVEIRRGGIGALVGYVGPRVGVELDVERHEHYYQDDRLVDIPNPCGVPDRPGPCIDDDTDAWIVMGHAVVRVPVPEDSRWRPYGTGGVGVVFASVHDAGPYDSRQTDPATDLGGGAAYRLTDWLWLRSDLRWFHVFVGAPQGGYPADYDFGRLALGVTFGRFGVGPR